MPRLRRDERMTGREARANAGVGVRVLRDALRRRFREHVNDPVKVARHFVDFLIRPLQAGVRLPSPHLRGEARPVRRQLALTPMDLFAVTSNAMRLVQKRAARGRRFPRRLRKRGHREG